MPYYKNNQYFLLHSDNSHMILDQEINSNFLQKFRTSTLVVLYQHKLLCVLLPLNFLLNDLK